MNVYKWFMILVVWQNFNHVFIRHKSFAIINNLIIVSADKDFIRMKEVWNFDLENWL